jgi:hypothetical protein
MNVAPPKQKGVALLGGEVPSHSVQVYLRRPHGGCVCTLDMLTPPTGKVEGKGKDQTASGCGCNGNIARLSDWPV